MTPLNFWVLDANSSKIVKAADFNFDVHVPKTKEAWPWSFDP